MKIFQKEAIPISQPSTGAAPHPDSFTFNGVDMLDAYGIRYIPHDVMKPALRPRERTIPERNGSYDYGAKYYDDRLLPVDCDGVRPIPLTRSDVRELAYLLSKKGRIVLGDEPDKYYIGRIYNPPNLDNLGLIGYSFKLTFKCDPFAYGQTISEELVERPQYRGTATTPTRVQLTNTGSTPIQGIIMRIRERRD